MLLLLMLLLLLLVLLLLLMMMTLRQPVMMMMLLRRRMMHRVIVIVVVVVMLGVSCRCGNCCDGGCAAPAEDVLDEEGRATGRARRRLLVVRGLRLLGLSLTRRRRRLHGARRCRAGHRTRRHVNCREDNGGSLLQDCVAICVLFNGLNADKCRV